MQLSFGMHTRYALKIHVQGGPLFLTTPLAMVQPSFGVFQWACDERESPW